MYKQKLAMALMTGLDVPTAEQIKIYHAAGFEGFAVENCSDGEDIGRLMKIGKDEDMFVEYLHAPFNKSDDMWQNGEIGDIALAELTENLEICAKFEIPTMVAHTFIGFDNEYIPTQIGIDRYGKLAKRADELGVKLALENTEGFEYLDALMNALKAEKSVGFCWDSGHELCYNYGKNLTALYGDRLICTHLNDNLGIRNFEGKITYIDDLHLLPFDGIHDWNKVAQRLVDCGFEGNLTFELGLKSKPFRYDNDKYSAMPFEMYVAEAYNRACRVAALYINAKENSK